jgi:hypothetical protein
VAGAAAAASGGGLVDDAGIDVEVVRAGVVAEPMVDTMACGPGTLAGRIVATTVTTIRTTPAIRKPAANANVDRRGGLVWRPAIIRSR